MKFLKENNPHYINVKIDDTWIDKLRTDSLYRYVSEDVNQNIDSGANVEMEINHDEENSHGEVSKETEKQRQLKESDSCCDGYYGSGEVVKKKEDEGDVINVDVPDSSDNKNQNSDDSDDEKMDEELEEANLKENQKEFDRKCDITIEAPSTCVEIDDIKQVIFSLAPGENSIPKFILLDDDFEYLAFPNYFPGGFGGYDVLQPRKRKIDL